MFILTHIRLILEHDSIVKEPIPPDLRLAICLYCLGRGSYYYTIVEMSGLGVSTACTITREVCQSIKSNQLYLMRVTPKSYSTEQQVAPPIYCQLHTPFIARIQEQNR